MTIVACSIDGCETKILARGWCSKHYCRYMKHGDPLHVVRGKVKGPCEMQECERPMSTAGLCTRHYDAARRAHKGKIPCTEQGCDKGQFTNGLCRPHQRRATAKYYELICAICGKNTTRREHDNNKGRATTCSPVCSNDLSLKKREYGGFNRISRAVIGRDKEAFLDIIKSRIQVGDSGCWEWQGFLEKSGYGNTRCNGKTWYVHRLVASMAHEGYDESLPVHHACANRRCCNPEHLHVVTPQENTAEMMERNYYIRRIAELENALLDLMPDHDLLKV